jgi:NTP pyrophosphatase (non-canonical NTP hydrolase)
MATGMEEAIKDVEDIEIDNQNFSRLQSLMHEIAKSKGWWNPAKSFGEQVVMFHSECSEAIDEYRKPTALTEHEHINAIYIDYNDENRKPDGVPIELADIIIRVMDTAEHYGIDLFAAILLKARYNLTRPERHGGKKL